MSEEFTITDISKELGGLGLMIKPNAAEFILDSELNTKEIINIVSEYAESSSTVDLNTVKDAIEDSNSEENEINENKNVKNQNKNEISNENEKEDISDSELNALLNGDNSQDRNESNTDESNTDESNTDESITENNNTHKNESIVNSEFPNPAEHLSILEDKVLEKEEDNTITNRRETLHERYPEWCETMFDRDIPESKPRVGVTEGYTVDGDITGESRGKGEFEDFRQVFKDRYERLTKLLTKRTQNVYHISDINQSSHGGKNMTVVGLVWSKFVSNNGNYFIELEDPKSNETLRTVFTDEDIKDTFEKVVPDEVIAIRGTLSDDGGIVFGDSEVRKGKPPIMFPDIPRKRSSDGPDKTTKAALISDIHVGADEFFPTYWNKFVDWVRTTPEIEYVIVAGDLVEGIGVFPDQDEELTIIDIYDQYAMTGKMFEQLPDDVQIITSVGNHDTVRLAEPQPTLAEEFTKYFPDNVEFVGNPVNVNIDGANILIYHGMSINAISEVIPGVDADEPTEVMKLMLEKRHVAPVYGKNVRLAGEEKDYLVIETVPDVLHCGHVHKYGQDKYNGVQIVNTATWQGQTSFQKSKGIEPDVGYWATVDLSNMNMVDYTIDDV